MKQQLTKEEIVDDIRKVCTENDDYRSSFYFKVGKFKAHNVYKYFPSWKNVIEELHFPKPQNTNPNHVSKDELVNDVLKVYELSGGHMTRDFYISHGKYSRKPIDRHFGSWNGMLTELGLPINCLINISEQELLDDIKRLYDEFGFVSVDLIRTEGKFSIEVYWRRFGGYSAVFEKLGLPHWVLGSRNSAVARYVIKIISEYLQEQGIVEASPEWMRNSKTGRQMFVDALFQEHKIAFEYDGPQHFNDDDAKQYWTKMYGNEETYKITKMRDNEKNNILLKQGFCVIRYPYFWPINKNFVFDKMRDFQSQVQCSSSPIIYPTSIIPRK